MPQGALSSLNSTPPAPMPVPQQPAQQQQPQAPAVPPAPTHAQTVATLRHFRAVATELEGLLSDPDLGKADLRSKIIDGASKLVADRIIPPAEAVSTLATVPDRPYDQRVWLQKQMAQAMQARDAVLMHHGMAFAGQPQDQDAGNPEDHMATMQGMMSAHYGSGNAGR